MQMKDRIAFVTGAGRGIGRAFCRELLRRGAAGVVIADLDGAMAQATAAELGGLGLQCDVSDEAAVRAATHELFPDARPAHPPKKQKRFRR